MHKKYVFILMLLICIGPLGCSDNPVNNRTEDLTAAPDIVLEDLSEIVAIRYNQVILIKEENLLVKFRDITEGRCPIGVHCFWEGQAIGDFLLIKPGEGRAIARPIIRASTDPDSYDLELADEALGYRLFLTELNPYPHIEIPTDPKNYIAKLRIEKLPED